MCNVCDCLIWLWRFIHANLYIFLNSACSLSSCSLTLYYNMVIAAIFHSVLYNRTKAIPVTVHFGVCASVHLCVDFTLPVCMLSALAENLPTRAD